MIPESEWIWQGHAGHPIVAAKCRFHLATRIGAFLISTVGEYHPTGQKTMERLGAGDESFYETFVFKAGGTMECGCAVMADPCEVEGVRYATASKATEGHLAMCRKYAASHRGLEVEGRQVEPADPRSRAVRMLLSLREINDDFDLPEIAREIGDDEDLLSWISFEAKLLRQHLAPLHRSRDRKRNTR